MPEFEVSTASKRTMRCNRCEGEWETPAVRPEAPFACPFCNVHVCACGCGEDMSLRRSHAIVATESHAKGLKALLESGNPERTRIRTVAEARTIQEDAKGHWSMAVREGICEVLRTTGYFHADDLAHLGIPDEHRNIIGSQTAKLVNQKWMVKWGERKSVSPGRNAAKSGIYQLTSLGRKSLAGVGAGGGGDSRKETPFRDPLVEKAGNDSGESGTGGRGQSGSASSRTADATPGDASPESLPGFEPTPYERMRDAA